MRSGTEQQVRLSTYQSASLRTWAANPNQRDRVLNALLGLAGEVGEVVEPIKKHFYHGKSLDLGDLRGEIGDCLFYLCVLASEYGFDMDQVAEENMQKLLARYPNGFPAETPRTGKEI